MRSPRSALAGVACLAMLAVGCGGGDDPAPAPAGDIFGPPVSEPAPSTVPTTPVDPTTSSSTATEPDGSPGTDPNPGSVPPRPPVDPLPPNPEPTPPPDDFTEPPGLVVGDDGGVQSGLDVEHTDDTLERWEGFLDVGLPPTEIAAAITDPQATPVDAETAATVREVAAALYVAEATGVGRDRFPGWFDIVDGAQGGILVPRYEEARVYGVGLIEHPDPTVLIAFVIRDSRRAGETEFTTAGGSTYYLRFVNGSWVPQEPE